MKPTNIIRILAGLSFLLFFCPFFQMCSDNMILKKDSETPEQLNMRKDSMTANAYELSVFRKLDSDNQQDVEWLDIFFTAIIVSSTIIFIKSISCHHGFIIPLCYLNLLLSIGFVISSFLVGLLDDFGQIKFGYYLFIINTITIIAFTNRVENAI